MTRSSSLLAILYASPSGISEARTPPAAQRRDGGRTAWRRLGLGLLGLVLLASGLLGAPGLAAAQSGSYFDRNNNVSVMDRPRPDYQATGVNLGSFILYPSLTGTEAYNDNIFATPVGVSDWITTISPSLDLKSNWSRNAVELSASDVSNIYAHNSSEDTNSYNFNLFGQLDTANQSNFSGGIGFSQASLPRTSEATIQGTVSPVEYDAFNANVAAVQTLNRLRFTESVAFVRTDYANAVDTDGAPLLLSQLDFNLIDANLKASWAISPNIAVFASGLYNVRRYDDLPPVTPLNRDSDGYTVSIGADFDITRLLRGQIQIGYLSQRYQSPQFQTVSGPSVQANVEYFLSGLTTITFHANRTVVDDVDPTAVSFLQTLGGVQIDHELLRNVILSGRAAYETDDFTGVQRNDQRVTASARATYLLNRRLGLTAAYSFMDLESSGSAAIGGYKANVVSLSLVFQL
jgi:hypothetical protein